MSANAGAPQAPHRHPRVLACVLCQHRKIKCDRNTPCSNCLKANVTCTPSTPAPARKRRRPNQDLQERLARCEALLKQYAGGGPPPAAADLPNSVAPLPQSTVPAKSEKHDLFTSSTSSASSNTPSAPVSARDTLVDPFEQAPAGKMIQDQGGARFVDNRLFASFYDELQAMRKIVDTEDPDESSVMYSGTEDRTPDFNGDLLFPGSTPSSSEEFHPDPVHAFRLWQIFLERVNPLTKIIHVPTVQPYVVEATTDPTNVPLKYQALLFSIYLMAVISLTTEECHQMLGLSRDQALQKFTSASRTALLQFDYLRNYDMASLQALFFFLLSLQGRYDRHACWVLSGTTMRIAQKMGYHRDGELLNLPPFETEMRRRIWWQILLQDAKLAVVSGLSHNFVGNTFDTKPPMNLNDADLFPGSNEPVQSREGPTEMAFVLTLTRLTKFLISEKTRASFEAALMAHGTENGASTQNPAILQKYTTIIRELDDDLREIERRYVDPSAGGVHTAALTMRPMLTEKMQQMLKPMQDQPEWGTEIFGPKDNFFKIVLMNNEHNTLGYERMSELGFLWMCTMHFHLDFFGVLTGQLVQRPTGSLSDRGWAVVEKTYKYQSELYDMTSRPSLAQAQFTLKAWKAREQAFANMGMPLETPYCITRLRELFPSTDSRSSTAVSLTPPSATQPRPPSNDMDQFLSGYLDASSVTWDMWGDMSGGLPGSANNNQISAALFGGFSLMPE